MLWSVHNQQEAEADIDPQTFTYDAVTNTCCAADGSVWKAIRRNGVVTGYLQVFRCRLGYASFPSSSRFVDAGTRT